MTSLRSGSGHSRRGRASGKSGHARYAPVATKFSIAAKCSDVPNSDIAQLFDHLISDREQPWRQGEAEHFRGLEIDHQLKFSRLQDW